MRQEAGGQKALPGTSQSLLRSLQRSAVPSGILRGYGGPAIGMPVPQWGSLLQPLPLLKPLTTPYTHTQAYSDPLKAENDPTQPYFADGHIKARRGGTCPRSHGRGDLNPRLLTSQLPFPWGSRHHLLISLQGLHPSLFWGILSPHTSAQPES